MTATADTGTLLLWNLLDNPACDTSRLIYADFLDERGLKGDRERAEFIRVQVELSRLPKGLQCCHYPDFSRPNTNPGEHFYDCRADCPLCRHISLTARERELCDAMTPREGKNVRQTQGRAFFAECGAQLAGYGLERGFLSTVSLTTAEFMSHAGAIFSRHPVERVVLTDRVTARTPDGRFLWDFEMNGTEPRLWDVPVALWKLLLPLTFDIDFHGNYASSKDADVALSTACITYGRQCALALRSTSASS